MKSNLIISKKNWVKVKQVIVEFGLNQPTESKKNKSAIRLQYE